MKTRFKIVGGIIALFFVGSWWMVTNSPDAINRRLAHAIQASEDTQEIEALLARGANPNFRYTEDEPGLKERINALLVGTSPPEREGIPLLFLACYVRNEDTVRVLLKNKANPNITFEQGRTPLMVAVENGSPRLIRLLLDHGGDPNHRTDAGATALTLARFIKRPNLITLLKQSGARE